MLLCGPFLSVLSLLSGEGNVWTKKKERGLSFYFFRTTLRTCMYSSCSYSLLEVHVVLVVDPSKKYTRCSTNLVCDVKNVCTCMYTSSRKSFLVYAKIYILVVDPS